MADFQFRGVGASNHTDKERVKQDYYATNPAAIDYLLSGGAKLSHNLWECACGEGHLSKKLESLGYKKADIKRVISQVDPSETLESQVKSALKLMLK